MKVVIIGAGIAGLGIAWDLKLRGFDIVIFEKDYPGSGASSNNAGVLHSGARYVMQNSKLAKLCAQENKIITKIAPFAVSKKTAFFLVHKNVLPAEIKKFLNGCQTVGISINKIERKRLEKEIIGLNKDIIYGYETPDRIVDFSTLLSAYVQNLQSRGVKILENTKFITGQRINNVWHLKIKEDRSRRKDLIADFVVTASGKDSDKVANSLGVELSINNIEGSMYKSNRIIGQHIISLCGPNIDGNVIVPLEDGCLIGSTWKKDGNNDADEIIEDVKRTASLMITEVGEFDKSKTLCAFRTHLAELDKSRSGIDYAIIDHEKNGMDNLISVLPGKFVLHRYVAEQTGDLICKKLRWKRRKSRTTTTVLKTPDSIIVNRKVKFQL